MFNNEKGLRIDKQNNLVIQSKHQANSSIIGMLLGDASMRRYVLKKADNSKMSIRRNSRIQFDITHCKKQLAYLLWKESILRAYVKFGELIVDRSKEDERYVYYKKTSLVKSTKGLVYLYENFYGTGKKIINRKLLNRLTDLGLAIWFMDDGSLIPHSFNKDGDIRALKLRLHTSNFDYNEHVIMKEFFEDIDVNFNITSDREYFCLSTGKMGSIYNFINRIKFFVELVNCMRYKIEPYNKFFSANHPIVLKGDDIVYSV
jgi:hypothetical protein